MTSRYNWVLVPIAYAIVLFAALALYWQGDSQLGEAGSPFQSTDVGTARWLAGRAAFGGIVVLIVTVLALGVLPPIHLREVVYFALAAVVVHVIIGRVNLALHGPMVTNQGEVFRTAAGYGVVLIVGATYKRRKRGMPSNESTERTHER
jgi:hypothetical protein